MENGIGRYARLPEIKKGPLLRTLYFLEEGMGFEPTVRY